MFRYGTTGVAIATCASYMAVFFYRVWDTKKYIRMDVFNKRYVLIMGILVLQAVIVYFENIVASILLVFLFTVGVILQYKTWYPFVVQIKDKVMSRIKK